MTGTTAIAFPGQGGDWRAAIQALDANPDHALVQLLKVRLGVGAVSDLEGTDTRHAQPAIFVAGLIGQAGARRDPTVTIAMGHSLGEITAATWAGAIVPEAGLDLMIARGALGHLAQRERPGAMAAINRWERPQVEGLITAICSQMDGTLQVGVINSATQIVLSGDLALVDAAVSRANDSGAVARRLPIGGAYHSNLMRPALKSFGALVAEAVTADPTVPVLSSTLHRAFTKRGPLAEALTRSLVLAVDWPATVAAAAELGVTEAVEAGPGDTLSRLARFAPGLAIVAP